MPLLCYICERIAPEIEHMLLTHAHLEAARGACGLSKAKWAQLLGMSESGYRAMLGREIGLAKLQTLRRAEDVLASLGFRILEHGIEWECSVSHEERVRQLLAA